MDHPMPPDGGWVGGSEDFGVIRTFDGHRNVGQFSNDNDRVLDAEWMANVRRGEDMDIGTDDGTPYRT